MELEDVLAKEIIPNARLIVGVVLALNLVRIGYVYELQTHLCEVTLKCLI